jgi:hypothetical protein
MDAARWDGDAGNRGRPVRVGGSDFNTANHDTVNHSSDEYVRLGGFVHINTAECRFSLMKRAVFGTHHSISEAHLPRYLSEWDYKWNTRKMTDTVVITGLAHAQHPMANAPSYNGIEGLNPWPIR